MEALERMSGSVLGAVLKLLAYEGSPTHLTVELKSLK